MKPRQTSMKSPSDLLDNHTALNESNGIAAIRRSNGTGKSRAIPPLPIDNEARVRLIRKKVREGLTSDEELELADMQARMDEYVDEHFPLSFGPILELAAALNQYTKDGERA